MQGLRVQGPAGSQLTPKMRDCCPKHDIETQPSPKKGTSDPLGVEAASRHRSTLAIGSLVVPFGDYLIRVLNINHKKELPRSLWVARTKYQSLHPGPCSGVGIGMYQFRV